MFATLVIKSHLKDWINLGFNLQPQVYKPSGLISKCLKKIHGERCSELGIKGYTFHGNVSPMEATLLGLCDPRTV